MRLQMSGTDGGSGGGAAAGLGSHPYLSIGGSGGGGLMDASVSAAVSAMHLGTDLFVDLCVSPKETASAPGFCAPPLPSIPTPSLAAAVGGESGSDTRPAPLDAGPAPADPALDAAYAAPGLLPAVSQADTSLCNQSMFSGYMPALTHRLYLAPILYAGYLAAWRAAAGAAKGSVAAARLLGAATTLAWGKGAPALLRFLAVLRAAAAAGARASATMVRSGVKRLAHSMGEAAAGGSGSTCSDGLAVFTGRLVRLLRSALTRCRPRLSVDQGKCRVAAPKRGGASSLLSFPLNSRSTEDLCGPDADDDDNQTPDLGNRFERQPSLSRHDSFDSTSTRGSGGGGGGSRRGGFARRLLRVAAVAAQAAGVPLAHAWLSGRGAAGGGGSRASPAASSGLGKPPLAPRRSGAESSSRPLGGQPPQPQRGGGPPPQQQRSRALTQLMLGLQPTHLHRAAAAAQEQKQQQQQQLRRQSQFHPVGAMGSNNGVTQQQQRGGGGGGGGARSEGRRRSIESEIFI